jgi:hypothetical protein
MRLAKFTSKVHLKPYQALLVGWQDTYNIYGGSPGIVIDDFDGGSFNTEDMRL